MTNPNDLVNLLNQARVTAAQDLEISNKVLDAVSDLVRNATENKLSPEKVSEIAQVLMDQAIKLTNHSKEVGAAINKIVGAA